MAKPYRELRAQMTPEAQATAERQAQAIHAERLTVGWVLDKDTSRRRIHVHLLPGGAGIGVTVETGERGGHTVVLDVEGASVLQGLVGEALQRVRATKEG